MPAVSSLPPTPAAQVGSILDDKYVLVRLIASGTTGSVFEGEHQALGKRVAVKVLHDVLSARRLDRFLAEARVAARITHPNVADVVDSGVNADGRAYLVTELCAGMPLEDIVAAGALTPSDACDLMLGVLHALGAAHAGGVVHGDLRPAKVLFDRRSGAVKLLDLGMGCAAVTPGG